MITDIEPVSDVLFTVALPEGFPAASSALPRRRIFAAPVRAAFDWATRSRRQRRAVAFLADTAYSQRVQRGLTHLNTANDTVASALVARPA